MYRKTLTSDHTHLRPAIERLENRECLTLDMELAANLNQTDPWVQIEQIARVGDYFYFIASDNLNQFDLWRTTGTKASTIKLTSLGNLTPASSSMTNVGGTLFFQASDATYGRELWKSDGTVQGTERVIDLSPGIASSDLSDFTEFNGKLIMSANGTLTITDGTAAGTRRVRDVASGIADKVSNLTRAGGTIYFTSQKNATTVELWKTNGTGTGTTSLGISGRSIRELTSVGDKLYYVKDGILGRTDANGVTKDFAFVSSIAQSVNNAGSLYFVDGNGFGRIDPDSDTLFTFGENAMYADNLTSFQGKVYFSGGDPFFGGEGIELWTTDGTTGGTIMLKNIDPGFSEGYGFGSYPKGFQEIAGKLYFMTNRGLWSTDGTADGTVVVDPSNINSFASDGSSLIMSQRVPDTAFFALQKLNLTSNASTIVGRAGIGIGDGTPSNLVQLKGNWYVAASDGKSGRELRKVNLQDGTSTLVKDIMPGELGSIRSSLYLANDKIFFIAQSGRQSALWSSDGTRNGTNFLANVTLDQNDSAPTFVTVGDLVYFRGFDSVGGWEIWKSDGTQSGTQMIRDLWPGSVYYDYQFFPNSSSPTNLINLNGTLYFSADTPSDGRELWKTDGTAQGTVQVTDIFPDQYEYGDRAYGSGVRSVNALNGQLYFLASDLVGLALWRSDGSSAAPERLVGREHGVDFSRTNTMVLANDTFYFPAFDSRGIELWKSDGTPGGTRLVKDIRPGPNSGLTGGIRMDVINNRLYFQAGDGTHGVELWESDGTQSGTVLVKDIGTGLINNSYPRGSSPSQLTNINGTIFFSAINNDNRKQLWKTNGANTDTVPVADLLPGPGAFGIFSPVNLTLANDKLYFNAESIYGNELFSIGGSAPSMQLAAIPPRTFREGGKQVQLAPQSIVQDADTTLFEGGKLSIQFLANYRVGDTLSIESIATPAGRISTIDGHVLFQDFVVGKHTGGENGEPLVIRFNGNASKNAVQLVMQSIHFITNSQNPTPATRQIQFSLTDGEGGAANPVVVRVEVQPVNDAPTVSGVPSTGTTNRGIATFIAPDAKVEDVDDSNLDGGELLITIFSGIAAGDSLKISSSSFLIDINSQLIFNGKSIGVVSPGAGQNGVPLRIQLNANARLAVVTALLKSIAFQTDANTTLGTRRISIALSDGLSPISIKASIAISVS